MTGSMENRQYTRLPLDIMVELHLKDGTRLYGETADISLDGAFVMLIPPPGVKTGQLCNLELIIKAQDGWVRVAFNCSIAHNKHDGIGLQFDSADTPHHVPPPRGEAINECPAMTRSLTPCPSMTGHAS